MEVEPLAITEVLTGLPFLYMAAEGTFMSTATAMCTHSPTSSPSIIALAESMIVLPEEPSLKRIRNTLLVGI